MPTSTDGWPYPDPDRHNRLRDDLHARDLYTEAELRAFEEDRKNQILANGGRQGQKRPCKCSKPTIKGSRYWRCTKCGGKVENRRKADR